MNTYNESSNRTFLEASAGALDNKERHAVALDSAENTVRLAADADEAIGTMRSKLQNGAQGDGAVNISLIGSTEKVVAGEAIAKGERVKAGADGRYITAATGDRSLGIKLTHGASTAGDIIEIIKVVETAP